MIQQTRRRPWLARRQLLPARLGRQAGFAGLPRSSAAERVIAWYLPIRQDTIPGLPADCWLHDAVGHDIDPVGARAPIAEHDGWPVCPIGESAAPAALTERAGRKPGAGCGGRWHDVR